MSDRYRVVGNPIAQSKSPILHREFARQAGQDMVYDAECVALDGFRQAVLGFRDDGGRGMNVTVPFKVEAFQLATRLSERAQMAEAVNTLKFDGAEIFGDNTDGAGFVHDVSVRLGRSIRGQRVLIMGAGGAVRGIMLPLLQQRPGAVRIVNRTPAKAVAIQTHLASIAPIEAGDYASLAGLRFDIVINATSASLQALVPPIEAANFAADALAYDMVYAPRETAFLEFARACGVRQRADGLGMLVAQAAESFYLWRGVRVDTQSVLEMLSGL